jgi:ribosome-associated translation inhibitor RaiA
MIELGGNISLVGFNEIDPGTMVVVKKIVGNYGRKYSEVCKKFESLSVSVKKVHEREKSEIYEMHIKLLDDGKPVNSKVEDRNLFVALDNAMKKVEKQITA